MPYFADRVKDVTSSTGTGAITLAGTPPTGFRSFATGLGAAATVTGYCIQGSTGEWEVGKGTFNGSTGLTRDVVRASSNGNALVSFSAGSKDVFITASSELIDNANIGLQIAQMRGYAMP